MRKNILEDERIYHVFTKSIAKFQIFRRKGDYERMKGLLKYYQIENPPLKYSLYSELKDTKNYYRKHYEEKDKLVDIIAYCLMPTHIHIILRELKRDGISIFMGNILNSYSRYFNIRNKRKGPLWESRFKNIEVGTDEQLLHLSRYIHLNPSTANLVEKPEDWEFSSYREYIAETDDEDRLCNYSENISTGPADYRAFLNSQKDHQRELAKIKNLCLE
ncbi:MAG: transposase [Thermodesulfovibrionales bacterium]|nr:transposase [Thermodesulfovibrionales bacterium]